VCGGEIDVGKRRNLQTERKIFWKEGGMGIRGYLSGSGVAVMV